MKLYLYYALHSAKNQFKKFFRSGIAIFVVACLLFGLIAGLGFAALSDALGLDEEPTPSEEETVPGDAPGSPEPPPDMTPEIMRAVVGFVVTAVVAGMLLLCVWRADKDGSNIFLMADVNLLFSAPMKPQSVLMFRLMSQIFLMLFASVYMIFQLPNLIHNAGLPPLAGVLMLVGWIATLIYGQLLNVLVYTVTSTHEKLKKYVTPGVFGVVALAAGIFYAYYLRSGLSLFDAADRFFNGTASRFFPVVGWIKGMIFWAWEGNLAMTFLCLGLLIVFAALLGFLIWRIPADFYEDAMAKSQIREAKLSAAREGRAQKRTKDRGDRVRRDGLFGSGAQMFFTKTVYNRFRFGILKIFSKTSLTYLAIALFAFTIFRFAVRSENTVSFCVVGFALCVCVFFRTLGDPLADDFSKDCFTTIPASPYAKVFWSLLGGTVVCAIDLLPALLIPAILLRVNLFLAAGMLLLAVAVNFYVSNVLFLINLLLPGSLALQVRQLITGMFIYFGMLPPIAVVAVIAVFGGLLPAVYGASFLILAVSGAVYGISPLILGMGRK